MSDITDAEMLAMASAFDVIPFDADRGVVGARVEIRLNPTGETLWAITNGRMNLSHAGEWEYEPLPSSRDEEFISKTRWQTARDAIAFVKAHYARYPTGEKGTG